MINIKLNPLFVCALPLYSLISLVFVLVVLITNRCGNINVAIFILKKA